MFYIFFTLFTNSIVGEEKKSLSPLLAKLYISPSSTETLICEVYDEVSQAIEDKLIPDATGRNALFKIHVSLGKIVNSLTEREKTMPLRSRKSSVAPSVADEEKTIMQEDDESVADKTELVKVEEAEENEESEGTVIADGAKNTRDSLVESLLSDDDDVDMTG